MSFQIFEQGRRIETPWQSSFPARQVNPLTKTSPASVVSGDNVSNIDPEQGKNFLPTAQYERQQAQGDNLSSRERIYRADQIMVSPVTTLSANATLDEAWGMFESYAIRHLPVVDSTQKVLGVVSERALLSITSNLLGPALARSNSGVNTMPLGSSPVAEVMHRRVLTATPDTNLRELTKVMLERRVGSILILSEAEQKLEGIITRSDVLGAVSHQVPLELWA